MFARYVASQNERIGSNSTMSATSLARNPGAADVQHPKPIMDLIDLSRLSAHGIRPLPEPAGSALAAGLADATRPGDYYGMPRERSDAWYRLLRMLRLWAATGVGQPSRLRQRDALAQALARMAPLEVYWSFPGERALAELALHLEQDDHAAAMRMARRIARGLRRGACVAATDESAAADDALCFSVLVVDELDPDEQQALRAALAACRREDDPFRYDILFASSLLDAWHAVLLDDDIQVVVLHESCAVDSEAACRTALQQPWLAASCWGADAAAADGADLAAQLAALHPELAVLVVADGSADGLAARAPTSGWRVVGLPNDLPELHAQLLQAVATRYHAPFFEALRTYRTRPMEVFHALPVSRGKALFGSRWMRDMERFYGIDLLQAETSAVAGGLDSLLEPAGPLKAAQQLAARAFGARQTFFVTQGTSTANKIALHALLGPGDIALVDRAAHKSVHYALLLAGAHVVYLDNYALDEWGIYGGVSLQTIKQALLELRRTRRLDRVKALVLTNCTFDGVVYNPALVMQECLAFKPDLAFMWDEAWFAFARFDPLYRQRTALAAADTLARRYEDPAYRQAYEVFREAFDPDDEQAWLQRGMLPDPQRVRVRVYATQSTHKTLTALRQGSMIHVYDQDFEHRAAEACRCSSFRSMSRC